MESILKDILNDLPLLNSVVLFTKLNRDNFRNDAKSSHFKFEVMIL